MTGRFAFVQPLASLLFAFVVVACAAFPTPVSASQAPAFPLDCTPLAEPVLTSPAHNATLNTNNVSFKWNAVESAAGYRIEIIQAGTEKTWTADIPTTTYTASNLEFNHSYTWFVLALPTDSGCNLGNPSVLRSFTISATVVKPETPQNVTASEGRYNDRVRVTWSDTLRAEKYQVYRKLHTEATGSLLATVDQPLYEDGGPLMTPDTLYDYRVRACNGAGCTLSTETATGWIGSCAVALEPPNLSAPENFASIQYNPESGLVTLLQWDPLDSILEYQVEVYDKVSGVQVVDHTVSFPEDVLFQSDLGQGVEFTWRVRALDPAIGCPSGAWSNEHQFRASPNPPPAQPTGLLASDGAFANVVGLNWDYAGNDSLTVIFYVFRSDSQNGEKTMLGETALSSFTDETVVENQTYIYWVSACGADSGCSAFSAPDTGWAAAARPDAPLMVFMPSITR